MSTSEDNTGISDQAILIYTWGSFGLVCQIINLFGIATNTINIICFVKQGFEDSVNVSLTGLAVSDLASLTTMVFTCICFTPSVVEADLPFEPIETAYLTSAMPHFAFTRVSGCITAMITLERCLCITDPLKVKSIITPKRTAVTTVCVFVIFICSGAPVYVVNKLEMKFSSWRNKTIYGLVSTADRQQVEMLSFAINNFVIPFSAFAIIVICTAILSIKLKSSVKWRQKTSISSQVDRVSNRNQKTATMVVMISTLFIVCFIPVNIIMLAMGLLPSLSVNGKHIKIGVLMAGIGYILESINSSMNIVIYYNMSSRFRNSFRTTFNIVHLKAGEAESKY